jgi:hypothetical protein
VNVSRPVRAHTRRGDAAYTLFAVVLVVLALLVVALTASFARADADQSCLRRAVDDAWRGKPMTLVLDDGSTLAMKHWKYRTKPEEGAAYFESWYDPPESTRFVAAGSIRRIEYAHRGSAAAGKCAGLVFGGLLGAALGKGLESDEPSAPQGLDFSISPSGTALGAFVGAITGFFVGPLIWKPSSETRALDCSLPPNQTAAPAGANTAAASTDRSTNGEGVKP